MPTQPHLRVDDGDVAPTVLLPGDPERVGRIADRLADPVDVARNREYRVVNGTYDGAPVSVCSTGIGTPSTAIAAEELARVGAERLIRVGTTGALQPDIDRGDLVVATAAAKEEGTSRQYESVAYPAAAAFPVTRALVDAARARPAASDAGAATHVGPIATNDAYYAEGEERVAAWTDAGLLAVEMEAAALFALARRRGVEAGAICAVDGNLARGTKKGTTDDDGDGELPSAAHEGVGRAIGAALDAAATLDG